MTPEQIDLIQRSFARVVPVSATAADLFYGRLFEIAPDTRRLFTSGTPDQGRKFMSMLARLVDGLNEPETLLPQVRALGERHACFGVAPEHYKPTGVALIWALAFVLGDDFTPDVRAAWVDAYALLEDIMTQAAAGTDHTAAAAAPHRSVAAV